MAPDLVTNLRAIFAATVNRLDAEQRLAALGIEPVAEGPAQFAVYAAKYVTSNADLLKAESFEPV